MCENDARDLIDLGSPVLPRLERFNYAEEEEVSDNLLDSELPVLEQQLQCVSEKSNVENDKFLVDIEEILITIDEPETGSSCASSPDYFQRETLRRSQSEVQVNVTRPSLEKSWSCDNLEALEVLRNLDAILDGSLGEADHTEAAIEACLLDLDTYLETLDSIDSVGQRSLRSSKSSLRSEARGSTPTLRSRLHQIEANYSRFLTSTHRNRAPTDSSNPELSRTNFQRLSPFRCTIGPICSGDDVIALEPRRLPMDVPLKTTWIRSSMRRLHHFQMPSDLPVDQRPVSAPSRLVLSPPPRESQRAGGDGGRSSSASSRSRRPRSLSSSVTSLASTVDSSPSCTPAPTPIHQEPEPQTIRQCERHRTEEMPEADSPLGQWPHNLSSMMACLGCTLGLANISRFALLTVHFGANFIFQFIILSLVFGLPLFTLQLCLGQQLGAGVIDMWRISPLFQGVGVALLLTQTLMGLYSIIGVSWMFVFFRDSFITKVDKYRWAEPFFYYRDDVQSPTNNSYKLSATIPDYFNGVVLQRHHLNSGQVTGTIKFQLAFNLAVVWMIVFVSLSKGLRSYGKVIYVFTFLPIIGSFILCAKIIGLMPTEYISVIFPETAWNEFFLNPKCWLAAAQEAFLTWGILGTSIMQIASHNKHKHLLQRDSSLVAVLTFTILLLFAFLANTCVQILRSYEYVYVPDSYEQISSNMFLRSARDPLPPSLANTPVKYMGHNSFFLGEKVVRPGSDNSRDSGYQVLRLATEIIPSAFAVLGADQLSPFWSVLFYFILILFGIAQQLAIWHCVITGIMAVKAKFLKSWETTITLITCVCGFLLGLPMATEFGIYVVYFMDYTVGGFWWLIIVILLQIVAVFMVRGRPYSGDTVVTALFNNTNHLCILSWAPALLSFTWNVILPVALVALCITTFKSGSFRDMFVWHHAPMAEYWPLWSRQLGSMIQLVPILLVPLVAVIQSYRYLTNGPPDILERIQLLYRPPIGEHMSSFPHHEARIVNNSNASTGATAMANEDPPPKYTPPPSYTTATGARIAKFVRQSIRRSVRRLVNVLGENRAPRSQVQFQTPPPPPDYNTVLVEINQTEAMPSVVTPPRVPTLERLRNLQPTPGSPTLTAAEVASILRSSFRRSGIRGRGAAPTDTNMASLSAENLVESAAPIGETSLVLELMPSSLELGDFKCNANSSVI